MGLLDKFRKKTEEEAVSDYKQPDNSDFDEFNDPGFQSDNSLAKPDFQQPKQEFSSNDIQLILTTLELINQRLDVIDRRLQVIEKIAKDSQ